MIRKYKINEVFYSLQGEGHNTGRAAVFVRFAGCNMKCSFCDTDFKSYTEMTAQEIVAAIDAATSLASSKPMVVLTGGEPTLQVDELLVDSIHEAGFDFIAMESNGSTAPPRNIDWLTVSPKGNTKVKSCNELKCIFTEDGPLHNDNSIEAEYRYLQPCDTGNENRNHAIMERCTEYIKTHPEWRLSLQTHKMIGVR